MFGIMRLSQVMPNNDPSDRFESRHEKTNVLHMRNKDADQLRSNREADLRLCFRYIDSTIHLLPIYKISSF